MTRRILTALYIIALAAAVAYLLWRFDWTWWSTTRIAWSWLFAASGVALLHRAWGVATWTAVLRLMGAPDVGPWASRARIWATAWMGRYLPGKVGWILGKVYFGTSLGISTDLLALGALVEVAQQVAMTLVVSTTMLAGYGALGSVLQEPRLALVAGAIGVVLMLHPATYRLPLRIVWRRRSPSAGAPPALSFALTSGAAAYQLLSVVLSGVSYVLVARAVLPDLAWSAAGFIFATFAFAGAVGMLAVFAPSGLGVREGVQMVLLARIVSTEQALVLAALGRVWSTAIDLVFFAATRALAAGRRRG